MRILISPHLHQHSLSAVSLVLIALSDHNDSLWFWSFPMNNDAKYLYLYWVYFHSLYVCTFFPVPFIEKFVPLPMIFPKKKKNQMVSNVSLHLNFPYYSIGLYAAFPGKIFSFFVFNQHPQRGQSSSNYLFELCHWCSINQLNCSYSSES